jgi:hypothetical protein
VQAVCAYCHSVLVRRDVDVDRVGVVSDLPPDSSPIQLMTEGVWQDRAFTVAGRIIYEYDNGAWNEWHLVFNDGASGWLSDAQLEYAVSTLAKPMGPLPPAQELRAGQAFQWFGAVYEITTVTEANYRGVEGELPFEYWDKERVRFADLRTEDGRFATIDYSEEPPLLFLGAAVEYDDLQLKNVRQFEGWT